MTDAAKRLYIEQEENSHGCFNAYDDPVFAEGSIEYLRADLAMMGGKEIVERVASEFPHFLTAVNPLAIQMLIDEIDSQIASEMRLLNDRDFIRHARTDIPALIAEVRRLREALGEDSD